MLIHGDCLEEMKKIPDNSVDMCLTDPPYGTTACKWDSVIPFEPMWAELKRIVKDNGAICLFGSEPFSSALRASNFKCYRYDWYWQKNKASAHLLAKKQPMRLVELISVFSKKASVYFPQGLIYGNFNNSRPAKSRGKSIYYSSREHENAKAGNYPKNLIQFDKPHKPTHNSEKPVALLEYLIKTYTLEGETVLDFTMGSGSTGVACKNLGRSFIGIEKDKTYFDIAVKRINEANSQASLC